MIEVYINKRYINRRRAEWFLDPPAAVFEKRRALFRKMGGLSRRNLNKKNPLFRRGFDLTFVFLSRPDWQRLRQGRWGISAEFLPSCKVQLSPILRRSLAYRPRHIPETSPQRKEAQRRIHGQSPGVWPVRASPTQTTACHRVHLHGGSHNYPGPQAWQRIGDSSSRDQGEGWAEDQNGLRFSWNVLLWGERWQWNQRGFCLDRSQGKTSLVLNESLQESQRISKNLWVLNPKASKFHAKSHLAHFLLPAGSMPSPCKA